MRDDRLRDLGCNSAAIPQPSDNCADAAVSLLRPTSYCILIDTDLTSSQYLHNNLEVVHIRFIVYYPCVQYFTPPPPPPPPPRLHCAVEVFVFLCVLSNTPSAQQF